MMKKPYPLFKVEVTLINLDQVPGYDSKVQEDSEVIYKRITNYLEVSKLVQAIEKLSAPLSRPVDTMRIGSIEELSKVKSSARS